MAGFERVAGSLTELMGRTGYKTPQVDRQDLPAVVQVAPDLPVPLDDGTFEVRQKHLEVLRDKAIISPFTLPECARPKSASSTG